MVGDRMIELGTFEVFHKGRSQWIQFHYCGSPEEAQDRFQWRYGYWPDDDVRRTGEMNNIQISDQHLKALKDEATRRPDSLTPATILSEWIDELLEARNAK